MKQFDSINFLVKLILLVFDSLMLLGTLTSCEDPISDIPDNYTMELMVDWIQPTEGLYKLKLNSGQ
jgi:hypothetical protein